MEEEKNLTEVEVDCPIHGMTCALTFTYNKKTWGKRNCFKCAAEILNQAVDEKQAEFVGNSTKD